MIWKTWSIFVSVAISWTFSSKRCLSRNTISSYTFFSLPLSPFSQHVQRVASPFRRLPSLFSPLEPPSVLSQLPSRSTSSWSWQPACLLEMTIWLASRIFLNLSDAFIWPTREHANERDECGFAVTSATLAIISWEAYHTLNYLWVELGLSSRCSTNETYKIVLYW